MISITLKQKNTLKKLKLLFLLMIFCLKYGNLKAEDSLSMENSVVKNDTTVKNKTVSPIVPSSNIDSRLHNIAPAFKIKNKEGVEISLDTLKGNIVVLNFWATWCPPCLEEFPSLERLRHHLRNEKVKILALSVDESWDPVDKLLLDHKAKFDIFLDSSKTIPAMYGTSKFPETFIIDKDGKVDKIFIGAQIWDRGDIIQYIKELSKK